MKMANKDGELWENNRVQFARLLAEINAVGLTPKQLKGLAKSMDLKAKDIHDIFNRAENEFDEIKQGERKFYIVNDYDANDSFPITAINSEIAAYQALEELGWGVATMPDESEDESHEDCECCDGA